MPKTRNEVAKAVADAFLPLELTVQTTAADAARCVATMIEQRLKARLPATAGAEAIALTTEAAQHLVLAANAMATAHSYLREIGQRLDMTEAYGPECEPDVPPAMPVAEKRALKLVAAAA